MKITDKVELAKEVSAVSVISVAFLTPVEFSASSASSASCMRSDRAIMLKTTTPRARTPTGKNQTLVQSQTTMVEGRRVRVRLRSAGRTKGGSMGRFRGLKSPGVGVETPVWPPVKAAVLPAVMAWFEPAVGSCVEDCVLLGVADGAFPEDDVFLPGFALPPLFPFFALPGDFAFLPLAMVL